MARTKTSRSRRRQEGHPKAPRILSMAHYVETVCRIRDEWIVETNYFDPWFRGQRDASWLLEPNIFRLDLLTKEDELRSDFQRRAPQFMTETPPQDFWDWYFLMQHYGAPTRLLDWTDSALIALFFALNTDSVDQKVDTADAVVWMLDPWWLNTTVLHEDAIMLPNSHHTRSYLAKPYSSIDSNADTRIVPEFPISIDPPFIARRVAAQRSHFTIFGNRRDGLMTLTASPDARLLKLVIPKEIAPRLRADLGTLGISDTSIYPDLRGLSNEVIRYQVGLWPPDPYLDE